MSVRQDGLDGQDEARLARLLGGLGSERVEPEAGFEQRVMRVVEARLTAGAGRRGVAGRGAAGRGAAGVGLGAGWFRGLGFASAASAASAVAVGVAVGLAVWGHAGRGRPVGLRVAVRATDRTRPDGPVSGAVAMPARGTAPAVQVAAALGRVRGGRRRAVLTEAALPARAAELMEASFPAPPAPLTEEEKLLLKVVHRGDPVELAMLDPQVREGLLAKEREEVEQFFYKPKRIDDKGNLIDASGKVLNEVAIGDQR